MITRMQKLLLVGKKDVLPELLGFIQQAGLFQVEKVEEPDSQSYIDSPELTRELQPVEKELGRVQSLLGLLPPLPKRMPAYTAGQAAKDLLPIAQLEHQAVVLKSQASRKEEELKFLRSYGKALDALLPALKTFEGSSHFEAIGFVALAQETANLAKLRSALSETLGGRLEWLGQRIEEGLSAQVIAFAKSDEGQVRSALAEYGFSELKLPEIVEGLPTLDAIERIQERLTALPGEISKLEEQLAALSQAQRPLLEQRRDELSDQVTLHTALLAAGSSHYTFFLVGWVPTRKEVRFQERLEARFGGHIVVQPLQLSKHEQIKAPILLHNHPLIKPFELLLSVFLPPRYDRIDPTPIVAFFFPLFFGLIMGDIGYGLLFLIPLLVLFFRSKPGTLRSVAQIGIICSAWTILFGILFGEFFGTLGASFGIHPIWINRETQTGILTFLIVALAVGVVQIFLGFILEIILSLRERAYRDAIEAASLIGWISGLLLALLSMTGILPQPLLYVGLGLLAIGWVGVIAIKGPIMGITEPLSTTGNILSYSRLMGIGVSSVYLAFAANEIGGLMGSPVTAFIVGAICHLLFLVLGIISPIIQSARLHFVEFFTKFKYHELSGNPYHPLAKVAQKGEGV